MTNFRQVGAGLCVSLLSVVLLVPAAAPGASAHDITAIYPPWWSARQSLTAAASQAPSVQPGAAPFIVSIHSETAIDHQRLTAGGALLLLSQPGGVCITPGNS
jgi:hypothetical protein